MIGGGGNTQIEQDLYNTVGPEEMLNVRRGHCEGETGKRGNEWYDAPSQFLFLESDLLIIHLTPPAKTAQKKNDGTDNVEIGYGVEVHTIIPTRLREAKGKKARKTWAKSYDGKDGHTVIENIFHVKVC